MGLQPKCAWDAVAVSPRDRVIAALVILGIVAFVSACVANLIASQVAHQAG